MADDPKPEDDWDDDFEDFWEELEDEGWEDCGMMPDGLCMQAGTEWCDWECPRNRAPRAGK